MVFRTGSGAEITGNDQYWLGMSYSNANDNFVYWGMPSVYTSGCIIGYYVYNSFGGILIPSSGVRPIVSLQTDIQLEKDATLTDTYNIK